MSINCEVILQWSARPEQLSAVGAGLWRWCNSSAGDRGIYQYLDNQALADGLAVFRTPEAGSFAKHTGLRRHMRGHSEIEGQDVDLPFVVRPATADG